MIEVVTFIELLTNAFALGVAGILYFAYISNLRTQLEQKEEKSSVIERNLQFWKDKANDLEKKTPDFIVRSLSDRIKIGEEEIKRLHEDKQSHISEIESKNVLLGEMRFELEKAKESRKSLKDVSLEDEDIYEMEELGSVVVDSGKLLITDPSYLDSEWAKEAFEDIRLYKDITTKHIFQFRKDFQSYQEIISGYTENVHNLIEKGVLVKVETKDIFAYSYNGASKAATSEEGYGTLEFKRGQEGAGFAFGTLYGDGEYPVYGEKIDGKLVRVMIDLS